MGASISVLTSVAESIKENETSMSCTPIQATSCEIHDTDESMCSMIPGCEYTPSSCPHTTKVTCNKDKKCTWDSTSETCQAKENSGTCTGDPLVGGGQLSVNKMKIKGATITAGGGAGTCNVDFGIKNTQFSKCEMGQVIESVSELANKSKMKKQTGWMLGVSGDVNTNITKDQIKNRLSQMCGTPQQAFNTLEYEDVHIKCGDKTSIQDATIKAGIDSNQQTDCLMGIAAKMETKITNESESEVLNDVLGGMGGYLFIIIGVVGLFLAYKLISKGKSAKGLAAFGPVGMMGTMSRPYT